jgi:RsmE family RNA methyltransferase
MRTVYHRKTRLNEAPGFSPGRVTPAKAGIQNQPIILIVGPEGGIIDYEIELLKAAGCQPIDLGPRIQRTESVLPFVVGKLF